MNLRYPYGVDYLAQAREYVNKAINHIHDHSGFEQNIAADKAEKLRRSVMGIATQNSFLHFCQVNEINSKADGSHYTESDSFDVEIDGIKIDVKQSIAADIWPQVTNTADRSNVYGYAFFLTDKDFTYIEPRGIISRVEFMDSAVEVKRGMVIPGTEDRTNPLIQKFTYSYFIKPDLLNDFETVMKKMRQRSAEKRRRARMR